MLDGWFYLSCPLHHLTIHSLYLPSIGPTNISIFLIVLWSSISALEPCIQNNLLNSSVSLFCSDTKRCFSGMIENLQIGPVLQEQLNQVRGLRMEGRVSNSVKFRLADRHEESVGSSEGGKILIG